MEAYREPKICTVCTSAKQEVVYHWESDFYDHDVYETCSWDGRQSLPLTIVKCMQCGHLYTSPAFKTDFLGCVYPRDIIPDNLEVVKKNLESAKYKSFAKTVSKFFPSGSVVGDVGTRYGGLPIQLGALGMEAFGVDYNADAVDRGLRLGAPVIQGDVESLLSAAQKFGYSHVDVVTMDDVSEHLTFPESDLRHIFEILPPGGGVVSRQMNVESLGHKIFGRDWYYLQPGAHMNYFSPRTLGALLERIGFKVVAVEKPSVYRNLHRMFVRQPSGRLKKHFLNLRTKRPLKTTTGEKDTKNHKPLYLQARKKSPNDMFTIVCIKP